jgi:hypothetical protein
LIHALPKMRKQQNAEGPCPWRLPINSWRNSCSIDENSFAEAIPVPNLKTSEAIMLEVIDATNTDAMNVIESLATDFTPETADSQNVRTLRDEIASLWSTHLSTKNAARATNEELRTIRAKLGEQLCRVKEMLAKPGRGGQWSSFLAERQIPRASADRLVARHLRSLDPTANCVTEPVSEPTEEEVRKLFASVWPKLRRTLRSQQNLDLFVALLMSRCEHGEPTVHEIAAVMPAPTFDPPCSDGDSLVEPEFCSAPPPGPDRATICAS